MGKITIDELSNELKERINELGLTEEQVQQLIDNTSGDKSQLQTNAKGSLVDAINELFQNANNGKELIATAIGEPLTAEDTFSAMSNGIDGLTTSFKTALMNNGVSVTSTDKFKQLIEKIATLADSEGKGIKFASGSYDDITLTTSANQRVKLNFNIDFTPTMIILDIGNYTAGSNTYNCKCTLNSLFHNSSNNYCHMFGGLDNTEPDGSFKWVSAYITNNDTLNIRNVYNGSGNSGTVILQNIKWYAIGVGEEDTTLEDTLRDILINKGIELTGEETLIDLILKVDEIKTFKSSLNIISATELPDTVVENQVCLVTNKDVNNIYIRDVRPGSLNEGDVYIKSTNINYYVSVPIESDDIYIKLNLNTVIQVIGGKDVKINGYVGINGEWVPTDSIEFYLFKSGEGLYSSVGGFKIISGDGNVTHDKSGIHLTSNKEHNTTIAQSINPVDVTDYTRFEINASTSFTGMYVYIGDKQITVYRSTTTDEALSVDISDLTGPQYIKLSVASNYQNQSGTVINMKLIKDA